MCNAQYFPEILDQWRRLKKTILRHFSYNLNLRPRRLALIQDGGKNCEKAYCSYISKVLPVYLEELTESRHQPSGQRHMQISWSHGCQGLAKAPWFTSWNSVNHTCSLNFLWCLLSHQVQTNAHPRRLAAFQKQVLLFIITVCFSYSKILRPRSCSTDRASEVCA